MIMAKQSRSLATEGRILDAAESLLSERSFDDLSVTGIAREAGVSVGGFYARFEGKEALLDALHLRYEERRTRRLESAFEEDRWVESDAPERIGGVIAEIVHMMTEERHVLRTFLLRYWSRPEDVTPAFSDRLGGLYDGATRILLVDQARMEVEDPQEAARAALGIVMGACRDILVMKQESQPGHPGLAHDRLIDYLTSAALAVLGLPQAGANS